MIINKKGISTVIATVLIVLITVAAVTVLWVSISPLVDQNLAEGTACFNLQNAIDLDSSAEFTFVNNTGASIRVERRATSSGLEGFQVFLEVDGSTVGNFKQENLTDLTANGAKVFYFNNTQLGITTGEIVTGSEVKASIAPMLTIDGELASCEAIREVEMRNNV
ncbi:MAG: hypothetical protein ACI83O_000050 [Patescibacteria group bacterium]|jgi:hypothetical protein